MLHPGDVAWIGAELGLVAIYLHGSRAIGRARADSDLDLALLGPHGWTDEDFSEAAWRVAAVAGPAAGLSADDVDVQDLRRAPPGFRARVVATGRPLYVGDTTELARFQAHSLCEAWDNDIFLRPIREAMWRRVREGRFAS